MTSAGGSARPRWPTGRVTRPRPAAADSAVTDSDIVVSLIGTGSAPAMLVARALLAGNRVPHRWLDIESDPLGRLLVERGGFGADEEVAVFADGSQLVAPA